MARKRRSLLKKKRGELPGLSGSSPGGDSLDFDQGPEMPRQPEFSEPSTGSEGHYSGGGGGEDWYAGPAEDGNDRDITIADAAAGHSVDDEKWAAQESALNGSSQVSSDPSVGEPSFAWEEDPLEPSLSPSPAYYRDNPQGFEDEPLPPMLVEDDRLVIADFLDDDMPPPTDEMPTPVLEDLANVYTPPMDLHEPPPIEGLVDRFTPVSVERAVDGRPSYQATPVDELPEERPVLPPPVLPFTETGDDVEEEGEEEGKRGLSWLVPVVAAAVVLALFAVVAVIAIPHLRGVGEPREAAATVTVQPGPRASDPENRGNPYASGADPLVTPEASEPPAMSAARTDTKVKASPLPPPPAAAMVNGTLKIRSNRRVLVKVNGQPRDYSPVDLPVPSGNYLITVSLPGRPDTEQTREVELEPGSVHPVNFTF